MCELSAYIAPGSAGNRPAGHSDDLTGCQPVLRQPHRLAACATTTSRAGSLCHATINYARCPQWFATRMVESLPTCFLQLSVRNAPPRSSGDEPMPAWPGSSRLQADLQIQPLRGWRSADRLVGAQVPRLWSPQDHRVSFGRRGGGGLPRGVSFLPVLSSRAGQKRVSVVDRGWIEVSRSPCFVCGRAGGLAPEKGGNRRRGLIV